MALAPMVNLKLFSLRTLTFILEGENLKESEEDHEVFFFDEFEGIRNVTVFEFHDRQKLDLCHEIERVNFIFFFKWNSEFFMIHL